MILAKTAWLRLWDNEWCRRGEPFACPNVVADLWEIDPEEEIRFEVHDKLVPESHLVSLKYSPSRWLLCVGESWALINFHFACSNMLEKFYEKHNEKFCYLTCVGRK